MVSNRGRREQGAGRTARAPPMALPAEDAVRRQQRVPQDEARHGVTELQPGQVIDARVDAGVDPAHAGLLDRRAEAA